MGEKEEEKEMGFCYFHMAFPCMTLVVVCVCVWVCRVASYCLSSA